MLEETTPVVEQITQSVDLTEVLNLMNQQNDILAHIYTLLLFVIGVVGAVYVISLLYHFFRRIY